MLYAASEIVFFLLVAAVVGGFAGYGLAQTHKIRLGRTPARSWPTSRVQRELQRARDQFKDLRRRLLGESPAGADFTVAASETAPVPEANVHTAAPGTADPDEDGAGTRLAQRVADAAGDNGKPATVAPTEKG